MGCIGSRLSSFRNQSGTGNLGRQKIFAVLNVDEMGRQISPGKIEVTETDLVLHVRGKPSLTWPLRCLRRYGYDNDLFSFESGRRCPTGAGIFAFRCNRAQSLFNLLQSKIQGNPVPITPATVPSTPITPTNGNSNNPSTPVSSTFVYVNLSENRTVGTNAPDVTQVSSNQTVPASHNSNSSATAAAISQKLLEGNAHPVYMNVDVDGPLQYHNAPATRQSSVPLPIPQKPSTKTGEKPSCGTNETINNDASILYTNVLCFPGTEKCVSGPAAFGSSEPPEVNYAELDLKTDNCSSARTNSNFSSRSRFAPIFKENGKVNDSKFRLTFGKSNPLQHKNCAAEFPSYLVGSSSTSSNNGELGYATIDFDRTAALSVVPTRSKINLDFYSPTPEDHSVKKTRLNSTAL